MVSTKDFFPSYIHAYFTLVGLFEVICLHEVLRSLEVLGLLELLCSVDLEMLWLLGFLCAVAALKLELLLLPEVLNASVNDEAPPPRPLRFKALLTAR